MPAVLLRSPSVLFIAMVDCVLMSSISFCFVCCRGGNLSENAKAMVHRVAVYDSQFHIKNIISQSDVVK